MVRHHVRALRTAELLASLGRRVFQHELRYGRRTMADMSVRYLAGVSHDVAVLPHPDRLQARTRRLARLGRLIPARTVSAARRRETPTAAMINGSSTTPTRPSRPSPPTHHHCCATCRLMVFFARSGPRTAGPGQCPGT